MTKRFLLIFLAIAILGCQKEKPDEKQSTVVTSIFPIYDIVKNIAGEELQVFFAVPPGANPHIYEPLPSDVQKLKNARLFIGIHPHFDGWMEDYLPKDCRTVYLQESGENDPEKQDEIHSDNPHIWLSVKNTKRLAVRISTNLSDCFEKHKIVFQSNLEKYTTKLVLLDEEIAFLLKDLKSRVFMQWHPAWDRFAGDYGLEIVGTVEHGHGDTPSVREFTRLVEKARQDQICVIVMGLNVESRAVHALSEETGARIIRLDTIGDPDENAKNSYIKLMLYNTRLLAEALNR